MQYTAMRNFVLLVSLLIVAIPSSAEVYKWVDEEGHIHFSDKKPENQVVTEIEIKISTYQSVSYGSSTVDSSKFATRSKVVILSASWCGSCKKAKKYFGQGYFHQRPYVEVLEQIYMIDIEGLESEIFTHLGQNKAVELR